MSTREHQTEIYTYECACGMEVETDRASTYRDRLPCPICEEEVALHELTTAVVRSIDSQQRLDDAVATARTAGATWQHIADRLGVTKQAAQQRYGR